MFHKLVKVLFAVALLGALAVNLAPAASAGTTHSARVSHCRDAGRATVKQKVIATRRTRTSMSRTIRVSLIAPACGRSAKLARAGARRGARRQQVAGCDEHTQIFKSAAFPGYLQSTAYQDNCFGNPLPSDFSQAADLQTFNNGVWHPDGDGPTEHQCGAGFASIYTAPCTSYHVAVGYRTLGVFTITWQGAVYGPFDHYSPRINVSRLC
jgi:hypothetical protein